MKFKTAISTATLLLAGTSAHAGETRLVGASDSPAAAVCIAAVESKMAARQAAAELGVFNLDMSGLICNGMSVSRFVAEYRDTGDTQEVPAMVTDEVVSFSAGDQSPATQLCLAALTSPARFEQVREQHFNGLPRTELEGKVRCNSKPLDTFVQEYRNQELTASL